MNSLLWPNISKSKQQKKNTFLGLVRLVPSRPGLVWIVVQSMPQSMSKNNPTLSQIFFVRLNLVWIGSQWFGFFLTWDGLD
jgi:hypothetical protein